MAHPFEHESDSASALIACNDSRGELIAECFASIRGIEARRRPTVDIGSFLEFDVVVIDEPVLESIGSDSLTRIRAGGDDVRIILLATTPPNWEMIGRCVDECLLEPVGVNEIGRTVETMVARMRYDRALKHFYTIIEQRTALGNEDEEHRQQLNRAIVTARERVDRSLDTLTDIEGYPTVFESMLLQPDEAPSTQSEG